MKITHVQDLAIPDVKVLTVQRYRDSRGYFLEAYRSDDFVAHPELPTLQNAALVQINESRSKQNVIRGLHTQCNPNLDKLLKVLTGHIVDVAVDIRLNSPTFGQAVAYELEYIPEGETEQMILIPFGFAHGIVALEESHIQYFQTGYWSSKGETCINFMDAAIDWFHVHPDLMAKIMGIKEYGLISEKDQQGISLEAWRNNPLAQQYYQ